MGSIPRLLACLLFVLLVATSADADSNCSIYGDPHLYTYKEERGTILIPCRIHATHFVTKIAGQEKWCEINVYNFARVHGGGVYISGAGIQIVIYVLQGTVKTIVNSTSFGISDYFIQSGFTPLTWASVPPITLDVALLTWYFNDDGALLDVPACGFTLVYILGKVRAPGIRINVSSNAVISPGYKDYVFCGDLNDTSRTLIDDARSLQLDTVEQGLAYRILNSTLPQQGVIPSLTQRFHPNADGCTSVRNYFQQSCPIGARTRALKICLDIFRKRRLLKCLYGEGETHPLTVFQSCMETACDREGCDIFHGLVKSCQARLTPTLRQMYDSSYCE